MAQVGRRARRERRAALRARHRQGDAGGRGGSLRRAAEDRDHRGRGRGRQDDRVHRRAGRGSSCRRGAVEESGEAQGGAETREKRQSRRPRDEAQPSNGSTNGRIKASPLARRIARERGVDLAQIRGTGPDGRIVAEDVERAGAEPAEAPAAAAAAAPRRAARSSRGRSRRFARRSPAGSPRRGPSRRSS